MLLSKRCELMRFVTEQNTFPLMAEASGTLQLDVDERRSNLLRPFMAKQPSSDDSGFEDSRDSKIQRFKDSRIQGFKD